MLGEILPNIQGRASVWLARKAAADADSLLYDLFSGAATLWQKESFSSYNHHERSCTVRLYAFCRQVILAERYKYAQVKLYYEAAQPSQEMLDGLADPLAAPIPDLTLEVGGVEIRLEAKVLRGDRSFARLYVTQGMARFLDGRYGQPGVPGLMVGYLQSGDVPVLVDWINSALVSLARNPQESLTSQASTHPRVFVHHSQHAPDSRLIHKWIDLR
ncbi:hypothetical protein [Actinomadura mexicana]|uniref:hypothetical protein n=1 Tax=Actinomadura mexicana TaxID=134959 RepID=UPI0011778AE1|nr:hypothetical protein [Actinomadura mexicana]